MTKWIAYLLPFFWAGLALADEVKDAPMPTEMNWVGIAVFAFIFFGATAGFIFAVWWKSRGKKDGEKNAEK